MEVTQVFLDTPTSEISLRDLAESTSDVYKLLRPWFYSDSQSPALFRPIRIQALSYVHAIDFSITAAQKGYNFCEDVIALAGFLDSSNETERQEYLRGMVGLAKQAEENAEKAKAEFRDVRIVVGKLVQDVKKQRNLNVSEMTSSNEIQLKEFEDSVSLLERFSACISSYISWWTTVHMSHKSQVTRQTSVVVNYNAIRNQDVLNKWKELRQEYVLYTDKIQFIQDANSDFEVKVRLLEDPAPTKFAPTDSRDGPIYAHLAESKKTHMGDNKPLRSSLPPRETQLPFLTSSDLSEHELGTPVSVDPTAMLFMPIAFSSKGLASRSNNMGKRDRFLHRIGIKH